MPFLLRLTTLICLTLLVAGCMKVVEKVAVTPPPPARPVLEGATDPDIPEEFKVRLQGLFADDAAVPELLLAVADHFERQGQPQRNRYFLDRAAERFVARRDWTGEARALARKARILMQTGREPEAAALIAEYGARWPVAPLRSFPRYLEGRLALLQGELGQASERLRAALEDNPHFRGDRHLLELRRDTELDMGIAAVLEEGFPRLQAAHGGRGGTAVGAAAIRSGGGMASLQAALALNRELRQESGAAGVPTGDFLRVEADAYAFLGLDAAGKQDSGPARQHLSRALQTAGEAGFREGELRSLLFLAETGLENEPLEQGRQAASQARDRADLYGAASYRRWARLLQARYARQQGRTAEAISLLLEADAIPAERSARPEVQMLAGALPAQRRAAGEMLVELLAGAGRAEEAFTAAERVKALVIEELLTGQDPGATPEEQDLLGRIAKVEAELRLLRRQILAMAGDQPTALLLEQLLRAEADQRDLLALGSSWERRRLLALGRGGTDPAVLQRLLGQDTTLFAYYVMDRSVLVWAIHREVVHLERIAVNREELRGLVRSFLEAIHSRDRRRTQSLSSHLYDLLLKPVIPFVSGESIGFIPDDCLRYLPFAALSYRGRYLIEGFSLFQLAAADQLDPGTTAKPAAGLRILALGDPVLENEALDLKLALPEIETIRKRVRGTSVLTGQGAAEAGIEQTLAGYDIVHFAVRGRFDPAFPLHSGLLLTPGAGQDGILDIRDLLRLRLRARAVVLSGCDPEPAADPEGKGLGLLQRAFLHAGSRSVITTLWLVEDRGAARLLDLFYRQLARRESPADSLRSAQLQLLREGQPAYVWAAFVLTGRY